MARTMTDCKMQFHPNALQALQEACEHFLVSVFEDLTLEFWGSGEPPLERVTLTQQESRPPEEQPRKRRASQGLNALKEIRKYQKSTDLLIKRLPFARVVKERAAGLQNPKDKLLKFQANAILALQEAAEFYLTTVFEDANLIALLLALSLQISLKGLRPFRRPPKIDREPRVRGFPSGPGASRGVFGSYYFRKYYFRVCEGTHIPGFVFFFTTNPVKVSRRTPPCARVRSARAEATFSWQP